MSRLQRQALALGSITLGSAGLYWAELDWLVWGLMGLIGVGMLLGVLGEGRQ